MQLDELGDLPIICADGGRIEHDLGNHQRADTWRGVGAAKRVRALRDEKFRALAVDVAAKGDLGFRRAEAEAVQEAGEVARRIGGKEIQLVAIRTERETSADQIEVLPSNGKQLFRFRRIFSEEHAPLKELSGQFEVFA